MKFFINLLMAVVISNIPQTAAAVPGTRAENLEKIEDVLSDPQVRSKLSEMNLTKEEVSRKVAGLTNSQLQQLVDQMENARFGAEPLSAVVITVMLVLIVVSFASGAGAAAPPSY